MMMVAGTQLSTLLLVFAAVPLGIVVSIYGSEGASALRHRRTRSKRP